MQMPPTLNSILPQVALEFVIAAIMANPCLQSVSDLEIMYRYRFIKKKILINEKKYWIRKRNLSSFCDSTHCHVTNCLDINSRIVLKRMPRNKAYYSFAKNFHSHIRNIIFGPNSGWSRRILTYYCAAAVHVPHLSFTARIAQKWTNRKNCRFIPV